MDLTKCDSPLSQSSSSPNFHLLFGQAVVPLFVLNILVCAGEFYIMCYHGCPSFKLEWGYSGVLDLPSVAMTVVVWEPLVQRVRLCRGYHELGSCFPGTLTP